MLINNYNNVYIIEIKIYLYFTTKLLYRYYNAYVPFSLFLNKYKYHHYFKTVYIR